MRVAERDARRAPPPATRVRSPGPTVPAVLALLIAAFPLAAQTAVQPIDRVVAIVGDRIILFSEIDENINQRRSGGLQVPEDSAALAALRRQVLTDLVDNEVVYQLARRDTTIQVTDAEVQQGVNEQVRTVRQQFRSDLELQRALVQVGIGSIEEWRRGLAEDQRKDLYRQRYFARLRQDGRLRGGSVSEADIRRAYDDALLQAGPERPRQAASVSFRQIVIAPQPTDSARAVALVRADSVRLEIERGADFATMARRFSADPSAQQGGDLGWFRREAMVREFSEVAFNLRPGVVSQVVRTQYGFHLIMVDRVQPAEVKARHILFAPEITDADVARAQALGDSLAALVRAGRSIDSLARVHGDADEPRQVGPVVRTGLDSAFTRAFEGAAVGAVVGPFPVSPDGSRRTLRIVVAQVTDLQEAREFTYDELRERIRQQLQQQRAVQTLLTSLRRQLYVDIRL